MASHKLVLDDLMEDLSFSLIGIHCNLEDYKLAYLINKALDINLKRNENDLTFKNGASYSFFEWENEKELKHWSLVSNIYKQEIKITESKGSLFSNEITTRTIPLIPEYRKVNYFLKICDEIQSINETKILNTIYNIPQVVTAYMINHEQLTSKGNLIF